MFLALAYAWLRLLLDLVDVRLRVHNPEVELASSPAPASRGAPSGQEAAAEYCRSDDHGGAEPSGEPSGSSRDACPAGDGSRLAPRVGEEKVGALRSPAWSGSARSGCRDPEADSADGEGQSEVGLCPSPRRIAQARLSSLGDRDSQVATPEQDRAGTVEIAADLESVPAGASFGDRAHRFLRRGYCLSDSVVRPSIYGAGDEAGDLVRGDRQPRRCLGDPASEECQLGAEPAWCAREIPDPRSRCQIRRWLRPRVRGRRYGRD